jgi:NodT family efflux transporter outer membrane factor (OMF) lipoprotein
MIPLKTPICSILLLGGLMAACSHQPPAVPDPVPLPERFTQSGVAPLPAAFWQAFADPELDPLVQQALQRNYSLAAKREVLNQADALLRQRKSDYWPTLNASLGASRSSGDNLASEKSYSGGLAASYEVDLWGRVRANVDAAELDRQATAEDVKAANISLAASVTSTWYQLVGQRGLRQLQLQQIDSNEKVLQLILARFQQGKTDAADVLRQKVLLEQNRAALADYESNIVVLENALTVLLGGVPRATTLPAADALPPLPALPDTGLTADWLQQRPDIRSAFHLLQAADARIAAAVAERYPRVDLTASLTSSSARASDLFDDWLENLAANLVLPVVDGGNRRAEVSRREAQYREAFFNYQQAILGAVAEVEDALAREQFQLRRIGHLQTKRTLDDQVVERLSLRYRAGAVDYLDVLQALITQQQTAQDLLGAQQQLLEYRIGLARALAIGWRTDGASSTSTLSSTQ